MFFSRKKPTDQPTISATPEPSPVEPPRLPKEISRTLTDLRPTLFGLYREIKGEESAVEVIEDFDKRVEQIRRWSERRLAEDQQEIEATVAQWHEQDLAYAERFADFANRFSHLRRSYSPILPANDAEIALQTPVSV